MHPIPQLLVGIAAAGVVAGPQRPVALIAGAVAGVLPDVIDWWSRQLLCQPGITVTPDPLAPTPATMAQGLRMALQQVRVSGRPIVVRLNPLPALDDGYIPYCLDCDQQHRLVVAMDTRSKPDPIDLPGKDTSTPRSFDPLYPLPLRITDTPVDLQFRAAGRRIEALDLAHVAGFGHALPVAGALSGIVGLVDGWLGLSAALALAAHVLLDAGGRRKCSPWLPFAPRICHGRRLWNEAGWRANMYTSASAACVIAVMVWAGR